MGFGRLGDGKLHTRPHPAAMSKLDKIIHMLEIDEVETSKRENQIGTLKPVRDTFGGSHFSFIRNLKNMSGTSMLIMHTTACV